MQRRAELRRARAQGIGGIWVYDDYAITQGMVVAKGQSKHVYVPVLHPELPGVLAKLPAGDEKAARRFVRRYGKLGYDRLAETGEPLAWIWAHAYLLNVCWTLTELLTQQDDGALEAYLTQLLGIDAIGCEAQHIILSYHCQYASSIAAYNHRITSAGGLLPLQPALDTFDLLSAPQTVHLEAHPPLSLRNRARKLRAGLINQHMGVQTRQLWDREEEKAQSLYAFPNTASVAYWHLANMIEHGEETRVKRCAECETWFVQNDVRQRFCAPLPDQEESSCAARHRMRAYRMRGARTPRRQPVTGS